MCYNCGCHIIDDDMGHPDNITEKTFEIIALKEKKTAEQVKLEMYKFLTEGGDGKFETLFQKAALAWGQNIDEAKRKTLDILKKQIH